MADGREGPYSAYAPTGMIRNPDYDPDGGGAPRYIQDQNWLTANQPTGLTLSNGDILNYSFSPAIRDTDAGNTAASWDLDPAKSGYILAPDDIPSWQNEQYGVNWNGDQWRDYIYGAGGSYATAPDGTKYYKPLNGVDSYDPSRLPYYYGDGGMDFGDWTLMGMTALASAGLTGLLPGTTSIFGGAATGAGAAAGGSAMPVGSAFGSGAGLTAEGLGTFGSIGTGGSALGGAGSLAGGAGSIGGGVDFLSSIGSVMDAFGTGAMPSLSGSTFGSIPMGSFGWESFLPGGNLTGMGAGAPLGTSSGSIWDTLLNRGGSLLKSIVAPQDEKGTDWGKVLMSLGNYFANERNADQIRQLMQQQDPFGPQRPFYQDVLKQSFSDPNFLQNNPTFQAMYDPAIRDVKARMAARGLNHSGNALHEIMRTGTETAAKYMLPFQTMTGQFAGSGIDPRVAGLLGMNAANADMTALGNIGVGLQEIWKTLNKGPQILY
jgi:hypothetical protein